MASLTSTMIYSDHMSSSFTIIYRIILTPRSSRAMKMHARTDAMNNRPGSTFCPTGSSIKILGIRFTDFVHTSSSATSSNTSSLHSVDCWCTSFEETTSALREISETHLSGCSRVRPENRQRHRRVSGHSTPRPLTVDCIKEFTC